MAHPVRFFGNITLCIFQTTLSSAVDDAGPLGSVLLLIGEAIDLSEAGPSWHLMGELVGT